MATETASRAGDRPALILGLLLVASTLAVFGRCLANEFVNYDDPQYVTDNPHVKEGLTLDGVRWAVTSTDYLNWHPLTWLSLQLDTELFGLEPWGFHLTAILLHAADALLLFLILRQTTGALWPSGFVAALFALHPLHVESVAWVAERKDVLSTLFGLLAIAAYLRYVEQPGWRRYLLVLLAAALSLTAKPMWVTLPGVLLLLDYWPLGRLQKSSTRTVLLEKVPLLALAATAGVLTVFAQHRGGAVESLELFPWDQRVGNAVVSYIRYLGMTVWPEGLAPFYPHPRGNLPVWPDIGAAVLLVTITTVVLALRRRCPYLVVGWFWYLGTLVPMIGLVQVGEQARADRYTYLPLIGIFIIVAFGLSDLLRSRRFPRALLFAAAIAVILACATLTWKQIGYWHDSRALWAHAVAVTADNY
ncbi:MAG: glycosyltransferase family 39 protein [Gemmataceae bacterium]